MGRLCSDGKQSAERNSEALQYMEKSWLGRNFSYTWEYQQHIAASSQKFMSILHSSVHGEPEMTVPGNISHGNTCKASRDLLQVFCEKESSIDDNTGPLKMTRPFQSVIAVDIAMVRDHDRFYLEIIYLII